MQDNRSKRVISSYSQSHLRYFDKKFIITNVVILLLALIAAYFEYVVYAAIISGDYPNFGEQNLTLKLSILTYKYDAARCYFSSTNCPHLSGVPALDFFQIFVIVVIAYNITYFLSFRKSGRNERHS